MRNGKKIFAPCKKVFFEFHLNRGEMLMLEQIDFREERHMGWVGFFETEKLFAPFLLGIL